MPTSRNQMPQRDEIANIHQRVDGWQRLLAQHSTDQRFNGRAKLAGLRAKGTIGISPGLDAGMLSHLLNTQAAPDGLLASRSIRIRSSTMDDWSRHAQ